MDEQNPKALKASANSYKLINRPELNFQDFSREIARLAAAYPRQEVSQPTVEVYHDALKDYSALELQAGIELCVKVLKFFPTVAEIREQADACIKVERFKRVNSDNRPLDKVEAKKALAAIVAGIGRG